MSHLSSNVEDKARDIYRICHPAMAQEEECGWRKLLASYINFCLLKTFENAQGTDKIFYFKIKKIK